jgi:probable rRNA maturation factor
MSSIYFFSEKIEFILPQKAVIRSWIKKVVNLENKTLTGLNFIFCSDRYLIELNRQYLNQDYLTDIITFDQSDSEALHGDIYISIARVKENATKCQKSFENELFRVMIHGVLHLVGFGDGSDKEREIMRIKEEASLSLLPL